jgi:hypothetical protein
MDRHALDVRQFTAGWRSGEPPRYAMRASLGEGMTRTPTTSARDRRTVAHVPLLERLSAALPASRPRPRIGRAS